MSDDFYRRLDEATRIGPGVRKILETPLVYGDCTAPPTASHYESTNAAKEDAEALNAAGTLTKHTAHSPLPWEVWKKSPTIIEQVDTGIPVASAIIPGNYQGRTLDEMEATAKANVQFIVAACNNYEALKGSHEGLMNAAERAERKLRAYVGVCKGDKELTNTILPMCDAALANAKKITEGL